LGGGKTGRNPTDRGKLGAERSVMSDAAGSPVGVATEGANRNDCKLAEPTIESIPIERPEPTPDAPQGVCLDKAYDHDFVRELLKRDASRRTCAAAAKKSVSYAKISGSARGAGSSSASTPGSTATAAC